MAVSTLGSGITPVAGSRNLATVSDINYTFGTGLSEVNNTISTEDSEIDHDALDNFVAAEHINWSVTGAEDIHVDRITSDSVTQHEADIDHNALTGIVANEHIDWTVTGAETIHDDRVTSSSVSQHEADIDHDALTGYVANEHIDWTSTTANISTSGDAIFGTLDIGNIGLAIEGIEVSITNDDTMIPTSGAVVDYVTTVSGITSTVSNVDYLFSATSNSTNEQTILTDTSITNTVYEEGDLYKLVMFITTASADANTLTIKVKLGAIELGSFVTTSSTDNDIKVEFTFGASGSTNTVSIWDVFESEGSAHTLQFESPLDHGSGDTLTVTGQASDGGVGWGWGVSVIYIQKFTI